MSKTRQSTEAREIASYRRQAERERDSARRQARAAKLAARNAGVTK